MTETYQRGMKVRREALGDAYVERATTGISDFVRPLQELVTAYCWGEVWMRPGLGRRERSLVNLGMLTALNRPNELRLHVRGAVRNGLTKREVGEALLQSAIYCSVPAAIDAFKVAEKVFADIEREGEPVA